MNKNKIQALIVAGVIYANSLCSSMVVHVDTMSSINSDLKIENTIAIPS